MQCYAIALKGAAAFGVCQLGTPIGAHRGRGGDRIVGFKEDYGPEFARPACLLSQGTWSNFAGGQKQTHLDMLPYGCGGYMSVLVVFKPEITRAYWDAVERGAMPARRGGGRSVLRRARSRGRGP